MYVFNMFAVFYSSAKKRAFLKLECSNGIV
jgi:hypothetical protein